MIPIFALENVDTSGGHVGDIYLSKILNAQNLWRTSQSLPWRAG